MKKKILIYNWVPFDEREGKGGGVTVYTRKLIECLTETEEWEVYFLSSGRAYDRKRKETFIEATDNIFREKCRSFQIVNSPVLSSAHLSFPYPWDMLEDQILKKVIRQFFIEYGNFDTVHFQNLEGLSLSVLELKKEFPETKFIYSLHNYYPFCPQVMLWKDNRVNCMEAGCGSSCISCMPKDVHRKKVIFNQQINYDIAKNRKISESRFIQQRAIENIYGFFDKKRRGIISFKTWRRLTKYFSMYRQRNVWYINRYMDKILAVSKKVSEIAIKQGICKEKIEVNYIGTEAALTQKGYSFYPYDGKTFYICYLGYMRKEKGFYFLLDVLEEMPEELANKIGIKLAVRIDDISVKKKLKKLKKKFAEIIHYQGYTHLEFQQILSGVQLGIVPPLWEDNLPQVAIELKAYGIPVLASDLGGAKELTLSKAFVFKAGDRKDFIERISLFVNHPERLNEYWKEAPRLVTMREHMDSLKAFY